MFKFLILCNFFLTNDTLPSHGDLFKSLQQFHEKQIEMELLPLEVKERKAWMKWLPNFGISYNAITNAPRPTLNFSFAQVYANLQDQSMRIVKKRQVIQSGYLAFKRDSFELVKLLKTADAYNKQLVNLQSVIDIENELFREQEARKEDGLILPVNWTMIRSEHAKILQPYWDKMEQLDLLILRIFELARM